MSTYGQGSPAGDRWVEALAWHTTLRESDESRLTVAVGHEWQEWYAIAENQQVFDDLSRLFADRGLYRMRRRRRATELEHDAYDLSVPISEWRSARSVQPAKDKRSSIRVRWWALLSGGIAVAATAFLFIWGPVEFASSRRPVRGVMYQTDVGRTKEIRLGDGSTVVLGGRTKVTVLFSAQRRSVKLIEGQAWFKVADNPRWPFMVIAGRGSIEDLGTAFLVTRESDRVVVTVTQGAVEVFARPRRRPVLEVIAMRPAIVPIRLDRGEEFAFGDDGTVAPVKRADIHAATAWTSGRLTFDNQPLRYVIETVSRYSARHIVISAPAGALRLSGVVFTDHIDEWLQSLQGVIPVTVEEMGTDVHIRTSHQSPATGTFQSIERRRQPAETTSTPIDGTVVF